MGATQYFSNNGQGTGSYTISQRKTIVKTFSIEKMNSLEKIRGFNNDVSVSATAGFNFIKKFEVTTAVNFAWERKDINSESSRTTNSTIEEEEFRIDQTLSIPPCTRYEIVTFVNTIENMPVEFDMIMRVIGINDFSGGRLNSEELKQCLGDDIEYIEDINSNTILAKTTGKMYASFGIQGILNADGFPIENCRLDNYRDY